MTLTEQAERRLEQARQMGAKPNHWIASRAAYIELPIEQDRLLGLPIAIGQPRSDWGLDLVLAQR